MVLSKRFRKTVRNISVCVSLTDIGIRKMLGVCKATVFYRFTAVYGPYRSTWVVFFRFCLSKTSRIESIEYLKKETSFSLNFYNRISFSNKIISLYTNLTLEKI
jgi:hypothetical protein